MVKGVSRSTWLKVANTVAWVLLIGIQMGLPLDFRSPTSRRFDTPITPAGYAFSIWGIIFLLQGLGSAVAWLPSAHWAHVHVDAIGPLWVISFVLQNVWTIIQYTQQKWHAGAEQPAAYWFALAALIGPHVTMSLALRRSLQGLALVRAQAAGGKGGVVGGALLYVLPSALNAGWLGLASCLGALGLAVSYGADYDSLVSPGLALLPLAVATAAFQPWTLLRDSHSHGSSRTDTQPLLASSSTPPSPAPEPHQHQPGLGSSSGSEGPAAARTSGELHHRQPASHDPSVTQPQLAHGAAAGKQGQAGQVHKGGFRGVVSWLWPYALGLCGYMAAIMWGLSAVLGAKNPVRPDAVRNAVSAWLAVLPVVGAAGLGVRAWLAARR